MTPTIYQARPKTHFFAHTSSSSAIMTGVLRGMSPKLFPQRYTAERSLRSYSCTPIRTKSLVSPYAWHLPAQR